MDLYCGIVNLPKRSHSEHAVIEADMYAFQNQIIIFSKMNPDPDYKYHSYHKKFRKLWWWNEKWLRNIELLVEQTHNYDIMSLNDSNNSVVDNTNDLNELKNIFNFLKENYKNHFTSKRYDANEITEEMYLKTNILVKNKNMKRCLMLYGCKTKVLNKLL